MPSTSHSLDLARSRCTCWARWSSAEVGSSISFTLAPEFWSLKSLTIEAKAPVVSLPMHQLMLPFGFLASLAESVLSPLPPLVPLLLLLLPPPHAVRASAAATIENATTGRRNCMGDPPFPDCQKDAPRVPTQTCRRLGKSAASVRAAREPASRPGGP